MASFMAKMDDCKDEVGAKDTDVEELVGKKPASSMEGKCLRACLMKRFEVMDNNGKFVKDVATSHAEKYTDGDADKMKIAHEIIDACSGIEVSDDHCEAAEQYGKCFKDESIAHGLKEKLNF
ncbi:general odorant-binding protein 28a-like isoform 2-T3 [Cochliomyia hominivorax]